MATSIIGVTIAFTKSVNLEDYHNLYKIITKKSLREAGIPVEDFFLFPVHKDEDNCMSESNKLMTRGTTENIEVHLHPEEVA